MSEVTHTVLVVEDGPFFLSSISQQSFVPDHSLVVEDRSLIRNYIKQIFKIM